MYGMVNKAVEEMVRERFGEEAWERIKLEAGVDVEVFISNEPYPDDVTYKLVGAASAVLEIPAADVLQAFGEYWVLVTAHEGYGSLMRAGGRSLPEFLQNLPSFHTRVSMIFPKLQPPRFNCTDVTASSLRLHYHTHREGLTAFVVGLLQGLGKMFETPIRIEAVERRDQGADHDVFLVTWSDS